MTKPEELLLKTDELLSDPAMLAKASEISKNFVIDGCGATGIILQRVNELLMPKKR